MCDSADDTNQDTEHGNGELGPCALRKHGLFRQGAETRETRKCVNVFSFSLTRTRFTQGSKVTDAHISEHLKENKSNDKMPGLVKEARGWKAATTSCLSEHSTLAQAPF